MSTPNSVKTALKITTEVDPIAARKAFDEIARSSDEANERRRQAAQKLEADLQNYASEGARNVTKYMLDSINEQIDALTRARNAAKIYSEEYQNLKQLVTQGLMTPQQFTGSSPEVWRDGLAAEKAELLRLRQKQEAAFKEEQAQAQAAAQNRGDVVGFASKLVGKTSQGGPGEEAMGSMVSGIKDVASSRTIWEGLANTAKMILNVAVDFYNDDKRRTREQLQAAGGTQQFARYFQEAGRFEQAKEVQTRLEYSGRLTAEEQKAVPQVQIAMARAGQGAVDVSSRDFEKTFVDLARTSMVLGQELTKFGGTVAEISRRTNEAVPQVIDAFARAGAYIDEYNSKNPGDLLNKIHFVETVEQVTKALKDQRYAVSDVTAITLNWAKELDKGTISVQEIVGAMKGMHAADPGSQAFLLQTAIPKMVETLKADMTHGLTGKDRDDQGAAADRIIALLSSGDLTTRLGAFRALSAGTQGSAFHRERGTGASEESMRRTQRNFQRANAAALREKVRSLNPNDNPFLKEQLENVLSPGFGINLQGKNYNEREALLRGLPEEKAFGKEAEQVIKGEGGKDVVLERQTVDKAIMNSEKHLDAIRDQTKGIWQRFKEGTIGRMAVGIADYQTVSAQLSGMTSSQKDLARERMLRLDSGKADMVNTPDKLNQYRREFGSYPADLNPAKPQDLIALVRATQQHQAEQKVAEAVQKQIVEVLVAVDPENGVIRAIQKSLPWIETARDAVLAGVRANAGGASLGPTPSTAPGAPK